MKAFKIFIYLIILSSVFFLSNCISCDDCNISAAPKQIKVENSSGKNLIFGSSKKYDPFDIVIKNNLNETVEFYTNNDNQTIDFTFSIKADTYYIYLNSTEKETIKFVYGKEKNIDCCNEFDVTKSTWLNSVQISNYDQITIVK
ncbi:MAG: hypothetical protein IT243_11490 [Bacteroidia bacterium]|nr:hypothetical protein [Bacteroidia bacterium]